MHAFQYNRLPFQSTFLNGQKTQSSGNLIWVDQVQISRLVRVVKLVKLSIHLLANIDREQDINIIIVTFVLRIQRLQETNCYIIGLKKAEH